MQQSNVHPIFEGILSAMDSAVTESNLSQAIELAEEASRKNNILLAGVTRIGAALSEPTTTLETILEIVIDTLEKVVAK